MLKSMLCAAALAATTCLAALPAQAQDYPFEPGGLVEMTGIHIEDGGGYNYATYLAGEWRKNQEFAKSKGWITDYKVYSNVHPRDGEPHLYLVVYYPSIPDAAEEKRRNEAYREFSKRTDAQLATESGNRAKFRRLGGSMLLAEMQFKK